MIDLASLAIAVDATQVKSAKGNLDSLTASGRKAEGATDALTLSSIKLSSALKVVAGSWAVGQIVGYVKEAALLNARYETLGIVMNVVGNQAGYSSTQLDAYASALRKSGITMNESRETIISMAQAQIDLTQATQLGRIAQDAAVIGGINSSEALGRLVYGIKSAQVEVLRTIGLNVNFESSYDKLAAQLGRTVASLTEGEKAQARANAAMEAGRLIAGSYEASMTTAGKQLTSLARLEEDLKVILGETFNSALVVAVEGYTSALKDATAEAKALSAAGDLREWGQNIVLLLSHVADTVSLVGGSFYQAGRDINAFFTALAPGASWDNEWRRRGEELEKFNNGVGKFTTAAEQRYAAMGREAAATKEVTAMLKDYVFVAGTDVVKQVARLSVLHAEGSISTAKYTDAIKTLEGTYKKVGTATGETSVEAAKFIQNLKDGIATLGMDDMAKKMHAFNGIKSSMSEADQKTTLGLLAQGKAYQFAVDGAKMLKDEEADRKNFGNAELKLNAEFAAQTAAINASISTDTATQAQYQYDEVRASAEGQRLVVLGGFVYQLAVTKEYHALLAAADKKRVLDSRTAGEQLLADWSNVNKQMERATVGVYQTIENSLVKLVTTGEAKLRDFVKEIAAIYARLVIQKAIAGIVGSFADGGSHPGGARIVGERGPELEVTGPSRIYSAEQTKKMLSGDGGTKNTYVIDARGADSAGMARLERMIRELNGSIERRAVSAWIQDRARGGATAEFG